MLSFVFGVVLYRISLKATISSTRTPELVRRYSPHVASVTGACINLVVIIVLSSLYERVAIWLTDYGKRFISRLNYFNHLFVFFLKKFIELKKIMKMH